jgi:2-desacetyl-2-hydroxyethyl bacteriochlorophyllide A dehydrogenase
VRIAELTGPQAFRIVEAPIPEPGTDELLVEVSACGVCSSELSHWTGQSGGSFPARIGHEVSGTVLGTGPQAHRFGVGQPVAVWTTGSGFADYVTVPQEYCRAIPATLSTDLALIEPLACASNAVELAGVRLADRVLIVGAGFMGLLVCQLVALRGAREVVVADTRTDMLALAAELGATQTVDAGSVDLREAVADLTGAEGFDITFEVTGAQSALDVIGDCTRMSGKLVLVGYHQGEPRSVPLAQWNWMAFDLRNAHFREVATIMRGMTVGAELLASGQLRMEPLVTHRFELADIETAFGTAVQKPAGFVKSVVRMDAADRSAAGSRADRS